MNAGNDRRRGSGDYRHNRMVWIQVFDDTGQVIQLSPDNLALHVGLEGLHLVAQPPGKQRGMIPVFQNCIAQSMLAVLDTLRVGVVEAMPHMLDPETGRDRNAQIMSAIQKRFAIDDLFQVFDTPGANGIAAGFRQQLEIVASRPWTAGNPGALDQVRFAIAQQREGAIGFLDDLHRGTRRHVGIAQCAGRTQTER